MPSVQLDPRDARPLTTREISKVLCGIIGGIATHDRSSRTVMPQVMRMIRGLEPSDHPLADADAYVSLGRSEPYASWAAALWATVMGLRGWCNPRDVTTALAWVAQNLELVYHDRAGAVPTLAN